jgi:hypothetical protein
MFSVVALSDSTIALILYLMLADFTAELDRDLDRVEHRMVVAHEHRSAVAGEGAINRTGRSGIGDGQPRLEGWRRAAGEGGSQPEEMEEVGGRRGERRSRGDHGVFREATRCFVRMTAGLIWSMGLPTAAGHHGPRQMDVSPGHGGVQDLLCRVACLAATTGGSTW